MSSESQEALIYRDANGQHESTVIVFNEGANDSTRAYAMQAWGYSDEKSRLGLQESKEFRITLNNNLRRESDNPYSF